MCHSCPRIPSRVSTLGQVRSVPVGFTAPWKSSIKWSAAASRAVSMYQLDHERLHAAGKSILTPTTPASATLRKYACLASASLTSLLCTHAQIFTFLVLAYAATDARAFHGSFQRFQP